MNSMGVRAALAFLLLFIATVEAGEGGVTFWQENFTMFCPKNGNWSLNNAMQLNDSESYELRYDSQTKGFHFCEYNDTNGNEIKYYFYVKGKACKNCFELDGAVFGWVIVMDVVGTACLMVIIYRCTKKKRSAEPTHTPKAPARTGGRPPPAQNPDYEQLSPHTRSDATYSGVNGM